jgi:hypothetical protein
LTASFFGIGSRDEVDQGGDDFRHHLLCRFQGVVVSRDFLEGVSKATAGSENRRVFAKATRNWLGRATGDGRQGLQTESRRQIGDGGSILLGDSSTEHDKWLWRSEIFVFCRRGFWDLVRKSIAGWMFHLVATAGVPTFGNIIRPFCRLAAREIA